jgi:DnaK suppressor protein
MDDARARTLLEQERTRLEALLADTARARSGDRDSVGGAGDIADPAQPLIDEEGQDAVAEELRDRLEAVGRAEARLAAGTYGRSVKSDLPIPDERLEANPAAELTVEEEAQVG